jgi:uncharacterized protein YegP (UPF0339 family)
MKKPPLFNYKIFKSPIAKQPYYWVCIAQNGEVRSVSEQYTQKHNAINAVYQEIRYRKKGVCSFEDATGEANRKNISTRIQKLIARN